LELGGGHHGGAGADRKRRRKQERSSRWQACRSTPEMPLALKATLNQRGATPRTSQQGED